MENHRNPAMAKSVEFSNIRIFAAETRRMTCFVRHELEHTYHDRVYGFDSAGFVAAYERAKACKNYDAVERWHGDGRPNTMAWAYAMTNPMEYLSESTEASFGRNDFYPFIREVFRKLDPAMEECSSESGPISPVERTPLDERV